MTFSGGIEVTQGREIGYYNVKSKQSSLDS